MSEPRTPPKGMRQRVVEGDLQVWFSLCSRHRQYQKDCKLCNAGSWTSWKEHLASSDFYDRDPEGWRKEANKPGSKERMSIEKHFPKLRSAIYYYRELTRKSERLIALNKKDSEEYLTISAMIDELKDKMTQEELAVVENRKWPPYDNGLRVKTINPKTRDWSEEALLERRWGVEGVIVHYHDSHGLCYDVRHNDTGRIGCYDPDELQLLD